MCRGFVCERSPGGQEATHPASKTFLQQQARFDCFIECYIRANEHCRVERTYMPGGAG